MRLADAVSLRSRRRKLDLFLETIGPTPATTVLDVGVDDFGFGEAGAAAHGGCATLNFFEQHYPWPDQVTALGQHAGDRFRERYPRTAYVQGDALDLPFPDGSFDVFYSNAVIEHVGPRDVQRRFVDEALRVAGRVFVTTPNRWFPVEVHTRLPLVHWLPEPAAHRVYDTLRKPWAKENHLLGPGELARLFPQEVRVVNLGLTLVAIV
ncbi:MAG TPA: class I SAM-dependent methyltransferase [Gaiellaceae bacterium]|jgi:SAM-dependent methyltransferase|nr:class I SAM-dependent methyltransferase [Gaiellaceae bacterium]